MNRVIQQTVGDAVYARGVELANSGAAFSTRRFSIRPGQQQTISGVCRGSRGSVYAVSLLLDFDVGGRLITYGSECTCPYAYECKHGVALFLSLDDRLRDDWRTVFERVFPDPADADDRVAAVVFEYQPPAESRWGRRGALLSTTPMRRARSGKRWVKTGADWKSIGRGTTEEINPAQLTALRSFLRTVGELWMAASVPATLWSALDRLSAAGIALIDTDHRPIRLHTEPASASVELRDTTDGAEVRPELSHQELTATDSPTALGDPAHGAVWFDAAHVLHLAALSEPAAPQWHALHQLTQPLVIPTRDLPEFEENYLPRVAAASGDLPDPKLLLTVSTTQNPRRMTMTFGFRYGHRDVPLSANAGSHRRDLEAEQALVDGIGDLDLMDRELEGIDAVAQMRAGFSDYAEAGVIVEITDDGQLAGLSPADDFSITVGLDESRDWLGLNIDVTIGDYRAALSEVITALAGDRLLVLPDGTYVHLESEQFDRFAELLAEARALTDPRKPRPEVPRVRTSWWDELAALDAIAIDDNEWLRKLTAGAGAGTPPEPVEVPAGLTATLRPYQEEGFRWLAGLRSQGFGGVLADDMGLGKTIQILTMLLDAQPAPAPWIVVAPTSVVSNWVTEAARFTPQLKVEAVTATSKRRAPLTELDADVIVTSYTLLRLDADEYRELSPSGVVLDEAQQVKNPTSKAFAAIRALGAPHVFAVTGTPIENSLTDAWALFALAVPGLLGGAKQFREHYSLPIEKGDSTKMTLLRQRTAPFLLRRRKAEVASDLPPIQEQRFSVSLSPAHRKLYDRRLARERQKVLSLVEGDAADGQHQIEILAALTRLRQMAIDPALVEDTTTASSKLEALVPLIQEAAAEGHRLLVFSQFTTYLRKVRDRLSAEGISASYLDGTTAHRGQVIDGFVNGDDPVFLVSLKAGGAGINLTVADYVILVDPWWNPAVEAQAIDRTHRIGQQRPVTVYRLVATDTIEEKVLDLQDAKRELMENFLRPDAGGRTGGVPLDAAALRELMS